MKDIHMAGKGSPYTLCGMKTTVVSWSDNVDRVNCKECLKTAKTFYKIAGSLFARNRK